MNPWQPQQLNTPLGDPAFCRQALQYLTDALNGGTAAYRRENDRFSAAACSETLPAFLGYTLGEYQGIVAQDALAIIYYQDRPHVESAFFEAVSNSHPIRLSCRLVHKEGQLLWVQINAGPIAYGEEPLLFAVFSGVTNSAMLQRFSDESMDAVYVVDANTLELLYIGGDQKLWGAQQAIRLGKPCYRTLHGRNAPCENCTLLLGLPDGERELTFANLPNHAYRVKSQHIDWSGKTAYIQYISDITEEKRLRRDWARLDRYYQTLVKNIPGGMAVIRWYSDGRFYAEFISTGFAAMTGMSHSEAMELYGSNALAGVHPEDVDALSATLKRCLADGSESARLIYRLKRSGPGYIWVQNNCSFIPDEGFVTVYSVYSDITEEIQRQDAKQRQYTNMMQRYRDDPQSGALLTALSNITQGLILEARNHADILLAEQCNTTRRQFLEWIAHFIPDSGEQAAFLQRFASDALCSAFKEGRTSIDFDCFLLLKNPSRGVYAHITEELMSAPDSGDLTAIMFVWDTTMKRVITQTQHRLISDSYDLILGMDVAGDQCWKLLSEDGNRLTPQNIGSLSMVLDRFFSEELLPRDREKLAWLFDPAHMRTQLEEKSSHSFHYYVRRDDDIRVKNAMLFPMDERLGWICLSRTDITDSMREQQGLLRMLAQTIDILALVSQGTNTCIFHSRESILSEQPPLVLKGCSNVAEQLLSGCEIPEPRRKKLFESLTFDGMTKRLQTEPDGYTFVIEAEQDGQHCYKQISVTWGSAAQQSICAVRRDVTRSVQAESQRTEHLRSALALARDANRAKQDFLASMSHDIRTPMNAIIGMSELGMAHRDDPSQVEESLRVIRDSANHLRDLIGDILDMSRIESGRLVLSKVPFSQTERLHMIVDRVRVLANRQGLEFTHSFNIQHDICVGDPIRLDQILENLLGNAVKFTPAGGSVRLDVVELPPKSQAIGMYCYTVSDTGIGMNQTTLKHLYDPFFREKSKRIGETEGSGLGLSIVKNLVDYKGGVMSVTSESGKGTQFVVKIPLPFATPDEAAKLSATKQTPGSSPFGKCLNGRQLLLVEDHPVNRLVAQRILQDAGAAVSVAENGKRGLEVFLSSEPGTFDAILMDLRMPVMDGYESTIQIRGCGHPQAKTIPIVAMTANAFTQDIQRCLDVGMDAHVAKPVDQQDLFSVLMRLIPG